MSTDFHAVISAFRRIVKLAESPENLIEIKQVAHDILTNAGVEEPKVFEAPTELYTPEVATTFAELQVELGKMTPGQLAAPISIWGASEKLEPAQLSVAGDDKMPVIAVTDNKEHPLIIGSNTGDETGDWKGDESTAEHTK